MDQARRGELTTLALKYMLGQEGIKLNSSTAGRLSRSAKAMGVSPKELGEFFAIIVGEMVAEHVTSKLTK